MHNLDGLCGECAYLAYDEEYDEYVCDAGFDEDDYYHLLAGGYKGCPHFRNGDEYRVVRHQI